MCRLVIDECDTPKDVTRRVKPEKCGWNTGFIYHGYCQEDPFWKQMSIWSFRVS